MNALLTLATQLQVELPHRLAMSLLGVPRQMDLQNGDGWDPSPQIPAGAIDPIDTIFAWGRGIVVVIGIIGVLFCAGKMAVGKFGRSDLAAEGVGGLVWTVLGISLMLVAVPIVTLLL
ncbi:hypothetical protein [Marinitenerispora sediminis]|uniref:hypothetical protein n=1 Tax=Marinitenerispora sediminis TaxID=1931232 RepID=UPI0015F1276D|nr:hypothetical protein [Marinitenerispora sediminis]